MFLRSVSLSQMECLHSAVQSLRLSSATCPLMQGGQMRSKELEVLHVKAPEHCPDRGKEHLWTSVARRAAPHFRSGTGQ